MTGFIEKLIYFNLVSLLVFLIPIGIARFKNIDGLNFNNYFKSLYDTVQENNILLVSFIISMLECFYLILSFLPNATNTIQFFGIFVGISLFMLLYEFFLVMFIYSMMFIFCSKTFNHTQYLKRVINDKYSNLSKLLEKYEECKFLNVRIYQVRSNVKRYLETNNCLDNILQQLILIDELSLISLSIDFSEDVSSYICSVDDLIIRANKMDYNNKMARKEDFSKLFKDTYGEKLKQLTETNSNFIKHLDSNKQ